MTHNYSAIITIMLLMLLTGCSHRYSETSLPEPRALGSDIETYRAPRDVHEHNRETFDFNKPIGTLTLRGARSLALMKNPELAAYSWEMRSREASTLQSGLIPNPELELEVENIGGSGPFGGLDVAETTIQLSQLIELGGKRSKRLELAALEEDLAGWDYESKRLDILTETTIAFVNVLAAQERLRLSEETFRLSEQFFNTVFERVKAGKVSSIEEKKSSVTLYTSKIQRDKAEHRLDAARKRLALMWGSGSSNFDSVTGTLEPLHSIPPFEIMDSLMVQAPEISRWNAEIKQRRAAVALEKARRFPDLSLNGGIRKFEESGDNAFVLGLSIPIPLFDRNQGGILEAQYKLRMADEERMASYSGIRSALSEAYELLASAHTEALTLKNYVLPAAELAFEATQEGYRQGKFGFLDVLDAQRTYSNVRGQYIEALADYHKATAAVERLIGQGIDTIDVTDFQEIKGE